MEVKTVEIVRNERGTRIKKICASCGLKTYKDGIRICMLSGEPVDADDVCQDWQMSEGLKNAGRGGGTVKDVFTKEVILK